MRESTYIVVIGGSHLETPVSYFSQVALRGSGGYIPKGMASFPFTLASPQVSLHWVGRGEIVPRPEKLHGLYVRVGMTVDERQANVSLSILFSW